MMRRDGELLARAEGFRRGAEAVLADLGLPELIAPVGRGVVVGSAACGLALSRDIDFDVLCPALTVGTVWNVLRPLAEHPRVKDLHWSDERGRFNTLGRPETDGIYCGLHYYEGEVHEGARWKVDCWFFGDDLPRPDIELRDRLLEASNEERVAILRLKDAAIQTGRYGWPNEFQGYRIYEAVLDRGVRRLEDV